MGEPMSDVAKPNLRDMIDNLTAAGYLVFKADECKYQDRPHGRHTLTTRSAVCEGIEPMPHGVQGGNFGTFGYWVNCQCGHSFAHYGAEGEQTPWERHKMEKAI